MTTKVIEIKNLHHGFGKKILYDDLNLSVSKGQVVGLLGKNGVGKTTMIKILMGFLRPLKGECRILGDPSHALSPETRRKVGLLFEGHLAYNFMSIEEIEQFYAQFYPAWKKEYYYELVGKLELPMNHRICNMSEGQRSQVVLGLLLAQDPEFLLLDDYSMGLDPGYRRLFLDLMVDYLKNGDRTVFLTSHVIQDMEDFVDHVIFLEKGGKTLQTNLKDFRQNFHRYRLPRNNGLKAPLNHNGIKNLEEHLSCWDIYSFHDFSKVESFLKKDGVETSGLKEITMSLEDAFIGYTGRY